MNKWYIKYVEGCSPKTISFKTEKEVIKFLNRFIKKYGSLDDNQDNFIEDAYLGVRHDISLSVSLQKVKQ